MDSTHRQKNRSRSSGMKPLHALADLYGIEVDYHDGIGEQRRVPDHTLKAILRCLNVDASGPSAIRKSLTDAKNFSWTRLVDDVTVVTIPARTVHFPLALPLGSHSLSKVTVEWTVTNEADQSQKFKEQGDAFPLVETRRVRGTRYVKLTLPLPNDLPIGYYTLSVSVTFPTSRLQGQSFLIVSPGRCYRSPNQTKLWGFTLQLYGLRSLRNWGIGDFHDLQALASWAGPTLGAAMIGLNPLHVLRPGMTSPYSPSSRLFHNPLYLNLEAIEEFRLTPAIQAWVQQPAFQQTLEALRQTETVDYPRIRKVKYAVLKRLYAAFRRTHLRHGTRRAKAFFRYCREQGDSLRQFAVFRALDEHFGHRGWPHWPAEFRRADNPAVQQFAKRSRSRVQFFEYVEWQCEQQLTALDRTTSRAEMPLGLYHDLAVGVHPEGADAWMFQEELVPGMNVGAPPDQFNLSGQNWGLLPKHPLQLRTHGYRLFRETLRQNMRHGGLLRIDHALGLFRLFWIPEGASGRDGAYVRYRTDELLAVLAVESTRHRVVVIGEDLGTVTPVIRRRLQEGGLLSYRLLMFEKPPGRGFHRPHEFPAQALVSVNTHDLPTLRGYWVGRDITLKSKLGLYPSPASAEADWAAREKDRGALLHALQKEHLLPLQGMGPPHTMPEWTEDLSRSIYAYVARTPCEVLAISLEDLLGELDTPNIPGVPANSYPVWERKLSRSLEDWRRDSRVRAFARILSRERLS